MAVLGPRSLMAGKVSSTMEREVEVEGPDSDAIKMFVGQVPRSMDEDSLTEFFSAYGPVNQLNILRDKSTGVSRGCCFVTYYTRRDALEAQNLLHNIKILPGMHHPIQMKPADTENRNERKLFIGMVSKNLNEEEIKAMFDKFGPVEECTVLRDDNGLSRGCAFVTFSSRQTAMVAIKAIHHSLTMEGCSSPIVVKFADTQKEKEQKKVQQIQTGLWGLSTGGGVSPGYLTMGSTVPHTNMGLASLLGSPLTVGAPQQLAALTQQQQLISLQQLVAVQQQQQLMAIQQQQQHQQQSMYGQQDQNPGLLSGQSQLLQSPYLQLQHLRQPSDPTSQLEHLLPLLSSYQQPTSNTQDHTSSGLSMESLLKVGGKLKSAEGAYKPNPGPDGANLFIYHLPQEFSDSDLSQTFQPFGTIVSAKVFVDKHTNLSKCFGFVSFTTNEAAHSAIQAMNGYQIGTKRLKVQLKRPKDAGKPY